MTVLDGGVFLVCVALATWAQALTGFAFGLILLGLVGVLHVVPLADAANACNLLSLVQAWAALRGGARKAVDVQALRDTMMGSVFGVAGGVFLLGWLSGNVVELLRLLLGLTILACAAMLLLRAAPRAVRSSSASFRAMGLVSGVMGGLFSTSGPPLVYHFYRQPMAAISIRHTLVSCFAIASLVRLAIVVPTGQFGLDSLYLSVLAAPLVFGVTAWVRRAPPAWSPRVVQGIVCALLVVAGVALAGPAMLHYLRG
ncbi:TSUP family transporter [Variovorax dokdonensis]|uniref:Probable membrane transporter protein n=1 Tax=Variovorax dokdonensis TaxID=344883 RepID=A0ABT7N7Q6_9BURK|nr:TSUP family transporter [Variovorax dokdonensis]MDM0043915.1 TSUP family transporter [Variovorax dokdonensis]